jgi:hypothetical protein
MLIPERRRAEPSGQPNFKTWLSQRVLEVDFFDLKNVTFGRGGVDDYKPSPARVNLCKVYQFWIARRRRRWLPRGHCHAHGPGRQPLLHLCHPCVRRVHRQGALLLIGEIRVVASATMRPCR